MRLFIFLSFFLFYSTNINAQNIFNYSEEEKIIKDMENVFVGNYVFANKPIFIKIFNAQDSSQRNFVSSTTSWGHEFLSTSYLKDAKVNSTPIPLCMIIFDTSKKQYIDNYVTWFNQKFSSWFGENNNYGNKKITIEYLMSHELGHCLEAHYKENTNNNNLFLFPRSDLNEYYAEVIADIFASMFLIKNNKKDYLIVIADIMKASIDNSHKTHEAIYYVLNNSNYTYKNLANMNYAQLFELSLVARSNFIKGL